ncbi:hypothetical protein BGZ63DRAFT_372268 [Mariannaea sp. PMI_226]|nr:hypothetical protein BGZ63DRAFT_372268 [Mariannaea sp. PMI_226]
MKRILQYPISRACPTRFIQAAVPRAMSSSTKSASGSTEFRTDGAIAASPKKTDTSTTDEMSPVSRDKKTSAELDAELREKLEALSGEGGGAGVEYEDGKAVGLTRGVKANMFRVI